MSSRLFSLFDDRLRTPNGLLAGSSCNLDSIGNNLEDSDSILYKIKRFEHVQYKIDYSDFSNFVFFNSALDYFNITGEKILNEYPRDGTDKDKQFFENSLDDYQRYVMTVWPSNIGHLMFDPSYSSSYVEIDDVGKDGSVTKTGLLSPGTGSFTVEFWAVNPPSLTGSNDVMVIVQKATGSNDGFTAYYSGSSICMLVNSGSVADQLSIECVPGEVVYYGLTYDRTGEQPVMSMFTGSNEQFPVLAGYYTGSIVGSINSNDAKIFFASGSIESKITIPFTGSLDNVRIWKNARSIVDISSSFNISLNAQTNLLGLWRFNESASIAQDVKNERALVYDYSGKKLHGTIHNYYDNIRGSGSLLLFDKPSLLLSLNYTEVNEYITEQQNSGTLYDRDNDNIITRLLPESFFIQDDFNETILKNFVYVLGRYFDQMKVSIDQFSNVLKLDYGQYNQTPDALLQDVANFFGWRFIGNFLDVKAIQYIVGRQVLTNTSANKNIEIKLFEIKNEIWKRTLINLMHLYKTKGTRESVESLLRLYGVNKNFIRLKESGYKPEAGLSTSRIHANKSVPALTFGSGSSTYTNYVESKQFNGDVCTIESRLRFPTQTSSGLTGSIITGSIWSLNTASDGAMLQQLYYIKDSVTSMTGSMIYTGSEGYIALTGSTIFDNKWYNVAVVKNYVSSSLSLDVRSIDNDEIIYHVTSSITSLLTSGSNVCKLWLGSTGSMGSQYWMQEVRLWSEPLQDVELKDHALNYQSFGTEEVTGLDELYFHWRLNENVSASSDGLLYNKIFDYSDNNISGSGNGFTSNINPYHKFLNEYNYIAPPEFGWTEDKIRSLSSSTVKNSDTFSDSTLLTLEFNLIDALNEDISQILATMENFNEFLSPVNKYRDSYPDLDTLRFNYFKRLRGTINFKVFADLLEFFDRSFIDMIRKLIPARATFVGDEFVVESHMLERPKLQWNYRRREKEFQPEGVIKVYVRF